jgi:uncharacterized membrane protein YccC
VQAAVATGLSLGVGDLVSSTHQYWATFAAYNVLGDTAGDTFVKGVQRILGTLVGAVTGFGLTLATGSHPAVVLPLLAVAVFASTYYRPVSPAVSSFWTMTIFATLYEHLGQLTGLTLGIRVVETVLGAAIALLVAWWVLPTHARTKLDQDVAALLTEVDVVVSAALQRLAGTSEVSGHALDERLLALDQHVRRLNATAAPLRRAAGAQEAGGIEGRLTAIWALAHATRHLVQAVEDAGPADPTGGTSADWGRLGETTRGNVTAVLDALAGRLPESVQPDLGVELDDDPAAGPPARAEDAVLRQLERINQTLLLLLDDISPGAVDREADQQPVPG